jgi:hypothetical protein
LKEKALKPTLWRTRFGSCYGPVVRQATEWVNKLPSAFGWGTNNLYVCGWQRESFFHGRHPDLDNKPI